MRMCEVCLCSQFRYQRKAQYYLRTHVCIPANVMIKSAYLHTYHTHTHAVLLLHALFPFHDIAISGHPRISHFCVQS